ncbi:GNAT family N-acetyltransferase [Undibacterium sp. Di27W]|uniref:GNAT family N-acetyltransferase n=1 Tax=Undibacterium sp. Di27W TaxID=3413036 RepID=UPI003BF0A7D8
MPHIKSAMKIQLREVDIDNFDEVIHLPLLPHQENYLASNAYSLAQSKYDIYYRPRAIYVDEQLSGFLMYKTMHDEHRPREYAIHRFMIDHRQQGRGIGRQALQLAIEEIRQDLDAERITICYLPENPVAKDFYASFGFVETGVDEEGEMNAEIVLNAAQGK